MRFASLGSGSHGNCTIVHLGATCLMIDLGFSVREAESRLRRLRQNPKEISAILVTHEHGDHVHGVAPFARKYDIPVYMTHGTWQGSRKQEAPNLTMISSHSPLTIGALTINPVPVPHDAREPCQFLIEGGERRLGILTDLGHVTAHVMEQYCACDALMLECNHDLDMLANGPYPYPLKQRVGGDHGHLNNEQAAELLAVADLDRLQHLAACHISEKNNTFERAQAALARATADWHGELRFASQTEGLPWLDIE